MKTIVKFAENIYPPKDIEFFLACLKEMECVAFVEKVLEEAHKHGYDLGYEDGFANGELC